MSNIKYVRRACLMSAAAIVAGATWSTSDAMQTDPVDAKVKAVSDALSNEERIQLTIGMMAMPLGDMSLPEGAVPGAGFVPGLPEHGVPPLKETDASLGISWVGGIRGNGATALPSGTAQGATWNTDLIEAGGRMIGGEARANGFNVLLAGGINLMRDPRNGRTFEYFGEDPLHSGLLGAAAVRGIQSNNVISTLKHYAINPQETGRHFMNVSIDEASLRESDLLAFQIAIEESEPGSIMCAYNRTNGPFSCGSEFLLTEVLRDDWGYKGFVMSDWGAVDSLEFAMAGLDQQSGSQLDEGPFFGQPLLEAASSNEMWASRLKEMSERVMYAIFDVGVEDFQPDLESIDADANAQIAKEVALEGTVLLKNDNNILPLSNDLKKIVVIGGHADAGTPSGGGSSRVMGDEGPAITVPFIRDGSGFSFFFDEAYHGSAPFYAIKQRAGDMSAVSGSGFGNVEDSAGTEVVFRDGRYPSEAALAAADADVAIVFATQYQTEGFDVPDLSLPNGQDALIAAVAKANPNTIVVLETGGPVMMPWLDDVAAVMEAWFPGAKGGEAIAELLYGDTNPSGHLPVTFPDSYSELPRATVTGINEIEPNFGGVGAVGQTLDADHSIEGSDVGYRWYARQKETPLFPFGHGLSYTEFELDNFSITETNGRLSASFRMRNTGDIAGADVGQVYLVSVNGRAKQRLVGFAKKQLAPGQAENVTLDIDPRLLAEWEDDGWTIAKGRYRFAVGESATALGRTETIRLDAAKYEIDGTIAAR